MAFPLQTPSQDADTCRDGAQGPRPADRGLGPQSLHSVSGSSATWMLCYLACDRPRCLCPFPSTSGDENCPRSTGRDVPPGHSLRAISTLGFVMYGNSGRKIASCSFRIDSSSSYYYYLFYYVSIFIVYSIWRWRGKSLYLQNHIMKINRN